MSDDPQNALLLSKITTPPLDVNPLDTPIITKSQRRVLRAYRRIQRVGTLNPKTGRLAHGWRGVMFELDLPNVRIVWAFVNENLIPSDPETRVKLFLPKVLPSERKHNQRRIMPIIGVSDRWEKVFFKKLINRWKQK